MARVFTTTFHYKGDTYTAIISQVSGSLSISVPDERLHDVLPDGKAVLNPGQEPELSAEQMAATKDLIVAILAAVDINKLQQKAPPFGGRESLGQ